MQRKRFLAAVLPLASLLLTLSCSKTEDVAPERKIFGDPPTIINFRILNPDGSPATSPSLPPATVECDFSTIVETRVCDFGFPGLHARPPVVIKGGYTQVRFEAVVDDPNTVRDPTTGRMTQSNLLLVAASFVIPGDENQKVETTLVLFNDGSANKFPQPQKAQGVGEDCRVDEGTCICQGATFLVDSNDPFKEDLGNEIFTRGFAFVNRSSSLFLQDCIMRERHQVPYPLDPGNRVTFRIDAVDRQGNLDTWENTPEVIVGQDNYDCTGDPCGCCLLVSTDPTSLPSAGGCAGLPGMVNDDESFELCRSFLPP